MLASANPNVPALITAATQWTDPTFTPEIANYQNRFVGVPFERISQKFPASAGWKVFKNDASSGISSADVGAGYSWDDGLVSVLAGLTSFPTQVYNLFDLKS